MTPIDDFYFINSEQLSRKFVYVGAGNTGFRYDYHNHEICSGICIGLKTIREAIGPPVSPNQPKTAREAIDIFLERLTEAGNGGKVFKAITDKKEAKAKIKVWKNHEDAQMRALAELLKPLVDELPDTPIDAEAEQGVNLPLLVERERLHWRFFKANKQPTVKECDDMLVERGINLDDYLPRRSVVRAAPGRMLNLAIYRRNEIRACDACYLVLDLDSGIILKLPVDLGNALRALGEDGGNGALHSGWDEANAAYRQPITRTHGGTMSIEVLNIADIVRDRDLQVRLLTSEVTIQRYHDFMESESKRDEFPPVVVYRDRDGVNWLADGNHRIMAAIRRKYTTIVAEVREGERKDAVLAAVRENSRHGLPLDRNDIRRSIEMILKECGDLSERKIAELVKCSQPYVHKIKSQLITSNQLTVPEKTVGKDGKLRPSTMAKKETPTAPTEEPKAEPATVAPTSAPLPAPHESPKPSPLNAFLANKTEPSQPEFRDEALEAQKEDQAAAERKVVKIDAIIKALEMELEVYYELATAEDIARNIERWARMILETIGVDEMREAIQQEGKP